jgi:hypothetical protein
MSRHTKSFTQLKTTHTHDRGLCNPYVVQTNAPGENGAILGHKPDTIQPTMEVYAFQWKKPDKLPANFINGIAELCAEAPDGSKEIKNDQQIIDLFTSCVAQIDTSTSNQYRTNGATKFDIVATAHLAKIQGAQNSSEERYSITFVVNPPLRVPFAVVLPAGHKVSAQGGMFSWMCSGGSAGKCEQPVIYITKKSIDMSRPALAGYAALTDHDFILAPDAFVVLQAASEAALAIGNSQAGADVKDNEKPTPRLLPPITPLEKSIKVHTPAGAAGAAGGATGGIAHPHPHPQPAAQDHIPAQVPNPFNVNHPSLGPSSPSSPRQGSATQDDYPKFAAFYLDPVKHKELIDYLAVNTLLDPNALAANQDSHDEPINIAGSRIIEALPWVTFYEALMSNDKNNDKEDLNREPYQQSFDTRSWREHFASAHIKDMPNSPFALDNYCSTTPVLNFTSVPLPTLSSIGATKHMLNCVKLIFTNFLDDRGTQTYPKEEFYLFWNDSFDESNTSKYLVAYMGLNQGTINAIRKHLLHTTATECFVQYMEYIDKYQEVKASIQHPGAQLPSGMRAGVPYWKFPETTDMGYWHDHAHDILCDVDSAVTFRSDHTKGDKLHKFIYTIAKRVFLVPWPTNPALRYDTDSLHHRVVVGSEFHVIIRLENKKALIFYTGQQPPRNCDLSSQQEALNTVPGLGTYV